MSDRHSEFSVQCRSWCHNLQEDVDSPVHPAINVLISVWEHAGLLAQHRWIRLQYIFISFAFWDFTSVSKNDFSMGRHDLYFHVVKTTCKSHSFFNLPAKI